MFVFNTDSLGFDPDKIYDLIILGGGPAALGCAIYAARFAMDILVIGKVYGGLIATTHIVENYPAITSVSGQELMEMFRDHINSLEIPYISDEVRKIEKKDDHYLLHSFFQKFKARSICLATGSDRRKLGIPGEEKFAGRGVSYCATCDGPFYKNKIVCVIGGSDSAAKEALFLAQNCKKVYVLYRGKQIRAEPINKKRVLENEKIEIIYETTVVEINGNDSVDSVTLHNGKQLVVDGVFIEIGSVPNSDLAKGVGVETNEKGEIKINRNSETNISGIYAAGDVADAEFKQAITGVAEGVIAAYAAFDYLKEMKIEY
ncbi:MAG: thioredoxin reductase [Candidatus Lokiarchaeota archaeon]|nr:thioredoxin reductase [Candidatus Lokiarchaeota archaeon]MBD3338527.1 thioredoxin reductase [Candidatus Lokiarchaeota archaeon]